MKQKKMILGVGALLASCAFGGMMTSCTSESPLNEPAIDYSAMGKVPVLLNIKGLGSGTRASYQTAFPNEKQVNSLYAVAFYEKGKKNVDGTLDESLANKFYKAIPVTLPAAGYIPGEGDAQLPYFDLAELNDYLIYFVANPGDEFLEMINGLVEGQDTPETFTNLMQTYEDGRAGAGKKGQSDFLMVQRHVQNVSPDPNAVTRLTIVLERAAARFDVINDVADVAVTGLKFDNALSTTYLFPPTDWGEGNNPDIQNSILTKNISVDLSSYGTDGAPGLTGGSDDANPDAGYIADLYTYERMSNNYAGERAPKITISYQVKDATNGWEGAETKTKEVNFIRYLTRKNQFLVYDDLTDSSEDQQLKQRYDALTDEEKELCGGLIPATQDGHPQYIDIERNHLYRIRVVTKETINDPIVNAVIEVVDWNADTPDLGSEEFEKSATWKDRVKSLYGYRFMPMTVELDGDVAWSGGFTTRFNNSYFGMDENGNVTNANKTYGFEAFDDDDAKGFSQLRKNMTDARYVIPSPEDFAAIFPIADTYDEVVNITGTSLHHYTKTLTNYFGEGKDVVDEGYVYAKDSFGGNCIWAIRFLGTDQCALYKYSYKFMDPTSTFIVEAWPLESDGTMVSAHGKFPFEVRGDEIGFVDSNHLYKSDSDFIKFVDLEASDFKVRDDELFQLEPIKDSERTDTGYGVDISAAPRQQLIFSFVSDANYLQFFTDRVDPGNALDRQATVYKTDSNMFGPDLFKNCGLAGVAVNGFEGSFMLRTAFNQTIRK